MARSAAKRSREALSPGRIEEAALDLIERDGLDGFSTRKLATELGCEAMSIYHYFPSKAHLVDALLDRVLGELPADDPAAPWSDRLEHAVLAYRAMAHRYPRFFQVVALHRHNTPGGLAWLERMIGILSDAGLDTEMAARFFRIFGYYVVGGCLDETAGYAKGQSAAQPVPDDEAARAFPLVTAVNPFFQEAEQEKTFLLGLDIILAAVKAAPARVPGKAPAAKRPARAVRRAGPSGRA
jgi:AcrR family transcriptional regulator